MGWAISNVKHVKAERNEKVAVDSAEGVARYLAAHRKPRKGRECIVVKILSALLDKIVVELKVDEPLWMLRLQESRALIERATLTLGLILRNEGEGGRVGGWES